MQIRWVNVSQIQCAHTFWGPDPRLHPGIVYSQYARDVDVEPGAASKIRNPKISGPWRKFPRKSLQCRVLESLGPFTQSQCSSSIQITAKLKPSSLPKTYPCATTTTYDNVQIAISWGHRLGGMWSRRLRRRRLLFLPYSPWSNEIPWETQFSEEEINPSFEI